MAAGRAGEEGGSPIASWIETDPASGRQTLKLPLPEPATVQRLADALQGLLAGWKR
jgi:hypothetical protein